MQYSDLIAALSFYTQQEAPDASFTAATPRFIEATEQRIYRELDFNETSGQNFSLQTTPQDRYVHLDAMTGQTVSDGTPVFQQYPKVVQSVAARVGNRWIPYQVATRNFVDMVWPDLTQTAAPVLGLAYYCTFDDHTLVLAPVPDMAYPLRIDGQWRPSPMSAANPATWLGTNLPDLLFAGVMAEALRYQRDFGAGSEDPQALPAWEARFQDAKRSALIESQLTKSQGPGYQPYMPAPLAMPEPPAPPGR